MPYLALTSGPGARIVGRPAPKVRRAERGEIRGGMSAKARRRAAFAFAAAPAPWTAMLTLTFREPPADAKRVWRAFWKRFRPFLGLDAQAGWIMEWTRRGTEHFHVFLGPLAPFHVTHHQTVTRHGKPTTLLRGPLDARAQSDWAAATGDDSQEGTRFRAGGILEALRSADAAARYVSKEAGKRAQKQAPDDRKHGRTWWTSYTVKFTDMLPIPVEVELPPWSLVFDWKGWAASWESASPRRVKVRRAPAAGGVLAEGGPGHRDRRAPAALAILPDAA